MNTDGTLDRDQMKKVGKLNPYLRDECGVPMKDSFRFAMVIVQNLDGIGRRKGSRSRPLPERRR